MKKSTQKNVLLALCAAAFGFAGYIIYKRYKFAKTDRNTTNLNDVLADLNSSKTKHSSKGSSKAHSGTELNELADLKPGVNVDKDRVLKKGMKTNEVKALQAMLNAKLPYYDRLTVDGSFGSKTEAALKKLTGKTQITLSELIVQLHLTTV